MPTWNDLRQEIERRRATAGSGVYDVVRRERLRRLADHTRRPVVIYAVDFLNQSEKARVAGRDIQIHWTDKEGFIEVTRDLAPGPLDLLLHSPGGDPLAAESIVSLLRSKFDDIRVFVPNVAKSAATMIALSADLIAMDERGELGPIDPQMVLVSDQQTVISPAQAILDQFERARSEVQQDPGKLPGWLPLLRQYGPSLLVEARNAITLSKDLVKQWLVAYMLNGETDARAKAEAITAFFGEHNNFLAHGRMVGVDQVIEQGVKVLDLRTDPVLRELVWDVYTTISVTLDSTAAYKIIENHLGHAYIKLIQQVQIVGNLPTVQPGSPQVPPAPSLGPGQTRPAPQPGMNRAERRRAERDARCGR